MPDNHKCGAFQRTNLDLDLSDDILMNNEITINCRTMIEIHHWHAVIV